jgi:hypothetical protein
MEIEDCKFLLLYFPQDKTFDIRPIADVQDFTKDKFLCLNTDATVQVSTTYDGLTCRGIVVQCGQNREQMKPYLEECVYWKAKGHTIEEIRNLDFMLKFNVGKRPHFPNRNVSSEFIDAI